MVSARRRIGVRPTHERRNTLVLLFLFALGLALVGCSNAPATESPHQRAPSVVHLSKADSGRTINVSVPATIHLALPYDPSQDTWMLSSGGAGFKQVGPVSDAPRTPSAGTQRFTFELTKKTTIPLVLDYQKPGDNVSSPKERFEVTLRGT